MECRICKSQCIKKGIRNKIHKYFCKACGKYQQESYRYKKYSAADREYIKKLNSNAVGISSISRITNIPKATVQRILFSEGNKIEAPMRNEKNQKYEMDEMAITVTGEKDIFLIYAINRNTRNIIDFFIGQRTKENLRKVVNSVLKLFPATIYTDGLNSYPSLIPKRIHKAGRYFINRIERKNLTLRTHLKRLTRKTLCLTRNVFMLESCLKIYLWGS